MDTQKVAYSVPFGIVDTFKERCAEKRITPTAAVTVFMECFGKGDLLFSDGKLVSPTHVSAGQTGPSLAPPAPRGRPPKAIIKESTPRPGDPGWEAYAAKKRDEFAKSRPPSIDPAVPSITKDPAAWEAYAAKKRAEEAGEVPVTPGFLSEEDRIKREIRIGNAAMREAYPDLAAEVDQEVAHG